jgi:transcriptional regulator with XRE-family HTH domain
MKTGKNVIGIRLRETRTNHSPYTQDQLSAKLARLGVQIDRAGISKIENGMRQVRDFELRAISKALGVPVEWLLGG